VTAGGGGLAGRDEMAEGAGLESTYPSAGGFQDRKVGLNLIRPPWIYQYKSGCVAIKVIKVTIGSVPSARHLSANFLSVHSSRKRLPICRTR